MFDIVDDEAEGSTALNAAHKRMLQCLEDGLDHGFFEMTVTVETGQTKKKIVTVKAGKSYRYVV